MTAETNVQPPSPRARLREITDGLFDEDADITSIHIPDVVDQITAQVDAEEMTRWATVREVVDAFVREYFSQRVARTRGLILLRRSDEYVSREEYEKRVVRQASRFEIWRENLGRNRGHIKLLKMKKADLLQAADWRENLGMYHLQVGALWRKLAEGMNDRQEVGDRYTTEQIAALVEKLQINVAVLEDSGPTIVEPPTTPAIQPAATPALAAAPAPRQASPRAGTRNEVRVRVPQPAPRRRK